MTTKLTVIYNYPENPDVFEKHYHAVHLPLATKLQGVRRAEFSKVYPRDEQSGKAAYRIAELYFASLEEAKAAMGTIEGKALADDALKLGTGGVEFLFSVLEN